MEKIRAAWLEVGDRFEMQGHDYEVATIRDGRIFYLKMCFNWDGSRHPNGHQLSMGCNSKLLVYLIDKKQSYVVEKKKGVTSFQQP
jgi:hypothetical protein